ncbi:MAG: hypothetical protein JJU28_18490 [Cyclobacteriaceae bacterium]|nr:hypothetical protein [Cyclobacteriaceae bacterium]
MKTTLIYFFVFQLAAWLLFFGENSDQELAGSITNSWNVVDIDIKQLDPHLIPVFNTLVLHKNGNFSRLMSDGEVEQGQWQLTKDRSALWLQVKNREEFYQIKNFENEPGNMVLLAERYDDKTGKAGEIQVMLSRVN